MNSATVKIAIFVILISVEVRLFASDGRLFDCKSTFTPNLTHDILIEFFGENNVSVGEIPLGEGFYEEGTILYANNPELTIEITWKNKEEKSTPGSVAISGGKTSWKTPEGITFGIDLITLEKINKSPFILAGFGWDYSGTVYSWENGELESANNKMCRLVIRMSPYYKDTEEYSEHYYQVLGDKDYSSENPSMRILNPKIHQMILLY